MSTDLYYWVAANGASAAMSSIPLPVTLEVSPVPEQLFGFRDFVEARQFQQFLLTAPMPRIKWMLRVEMPMAISSGHIKYIRPPNPERPSRAGTMWACSGSPPAQDGQNRTSGEMN